MKQIKMNYSHYIKSPLSHFAFLKGKSFYIFIFYSITEPGQFVWSRHLFAGLLSDLYGKNEEQLPQKTVGRLLANSRTTVDRQSDDSRPTVVYHLLRKSSAGSRPTVGRLSADCWPHVGNLLAKCRWRTLVEYQKSLSSQGRTLHIDAK